MKGGGEKGSLKPARRIKGGRYRVTQEKSKGRNGAEGRVRDEKDIRSHGLQP